VALSLAFSWLAGVLSILSPCVLPLLPIVMIGALRQHRLAPLALMGGLALSFAGTGLLIASVGFTLDIDGSLVRNIGAAMLIAFGTTLLVPRLQTAFAGVVAPMSQGSNALLGRLAPDGLSGQFLIGLLLGIVWAPCTGPTLGAAIGMAAQSDSLLRAGAIMFVFGIGAVTPMLALAYGSRQAIAARRERLAQFARNTKPMLGGVLIALGLLVWTGLDKKLETVLTEAMPDWLITLTTKF